MISKGAHECFVYIVLPGQTEARWYPVARAAGVSEADCERIAIAFAYPGFHLAPQAAPY